jgi:DNA repair protein RecN (Recombination protein N)
MIKSLLIRDYALIDKIHIKFGKGLNIITGETGAGKSILLGALSLLLGDRASTDIIRKGSGKTIVEGKFSITGNTKVEQLLKEYELDQQEELIVRREISLKGNNRCFINDTPANLNVIKEIGNLLVDLHGQHEHQSLLRTETHLQVIDESGSYDDLIKEYANKFNLLKNEEKKFKEILKKEASLQEKKDLYEFQLKEIDAVSPLPEEDEHLEKELLILENAEKLMSLASGLYAALYEDDGSAHDILVSALNHIQELARIDSAFEEKSEEFNSAILIVNDVAEFMRGYRDKIDLDPTRIESVRERLGILTLLKKKYSGSIESVLRKRDEVAAEVELAENYTEKISEIKSILQKQRADCGKIAHQLSEKRKFSAEKIGQQIILELKNLGISDAQFETQIIRKVAADEENSVLIDGKNYRSDERGIDIVEFYISTNKGEDVKPLAKVVSGGEVSRIMLSLKSVLAKNEKLPLLVFDEIDTGVSGRIAQKVGKALKSLADYHQIIAITHLPQIAAMADIHFIVAKAEEGDRVVSRIKLLTKDESLNEVAKLLSGESVTSASLDSARQLVKST